jgi:aspartate/methionine/tyrosine aminotransferase
VTAAKEINQAIRQASPALFTALSDLGRRVFFPPDIPFQAAEARDKAYNATIGQITDGHGQPATLPSIARCLDSLEPGDRSRALLYSPVQGIQGARECWRAWQRRGRPETPSTLPLVSVGLTHGLALVADLFAGPGRAVAVATPFWGNYRQTFAGRTGARMLSAPAYAGGRYHCEAIAEALAGEPPGEPALAILNLPSNPGGYSPTVEERARLRDSLLEVAAQRPLVLVFDDAYAGLVYEEGVPRESMFWELTGVHENLVPIKLDGATKEFTLFGGRVGFLTFPFQPDSEVGAALESKVKCLVRATVGSPVATGQMLLLEALRKQGIEEEVESVRSLLEGRYRVLKEALAEVDPELLTPLPFNSGCFALLELPAALGLDAERVRRHLLDQHDAGLIAIPPDHLRIAFCSVAADALPELVRRIERAVAELRTTTDP